MSDWEDEEATPVAKVQKYNRFNNERKNDDEWESDHGSEPQRSNNNRHSMDDAQNGANGTAFDVDPRNVGLVIGRAGATIREIERKFNVKLQIGIFLHRKIKNINKKS